MITLNEAKELVRIESWDDILSRPGFSPDVDPKSVKLTSIIGSYSLSADIPCGLSTCRQPHLNGYLVVCQGGVETNLGHHCGKKHFSVEFTQLKRAFTRDLNSKIRREHLQSIQARLPSVEQELGALRADAHGPAWVHTKVSQLLGNSGSLPRSIVAAVRETARAGNGALVMERRLSREERERANIATEIAGLERSQRQESFVREIVGQLEGYAALSRESSLRSVLTEKLLPFIDTLRETDVDSLDPKALNALYRAGADFDALLEQLHSAVAQGRRLLHRANLAQLLQFAPSPSDRRVMQAFLEGLPAEA